jgi:hypothetical protein
MNRHATALRMADDNPDLLGLAERFLAAVREAEAEGKSPDADPAVMLIGARISFLVHADIGTNSMYRQLIEKCELHARDAVVQSTGALQ